MTDGPNWEAEPTPGTEAPVPGPKPMRFGTILDVGVRILRRRWAPLVALSLLFVGPGALLTAATGMRFNEVALDLFPGISEGVLDDGLQLDDEQLERILGALAAYLLATIMAGVLGSIGALGLSAVVAADYHAQPVRFRSALHWCLRRAPSALAFILVTTFIIIGVLLLALVAILLATTLFAAGSVGAGGPGVFLALVVLVGLVVAVVYLTMRWAPAFPVMVNEDAGWRVAWSRSWHLSGDNVWRIFLVIAFATLVSTMLAAVISQILGSLVVAALGPALGLDDVAGATVGVAIGTVLLAPVVPVMTAVLYFDLRARRDPVESTPPETEEPASP